MDFYARRIRRIFPALAFLLLGVILLGSLFLTPEEFKNLGKQTIYGSAFGENIFLIRHSGGYWDTATEMKPLMHLWTLAVEEQYYIFYPLLTLLDPLEGKEKSLAGPLCLMAGFFWFRSLSESNFIYCCFLFSPYSFLGTLYRMYSCCFSKP